MNWNRRQFVSLPLAFSVLRSGLGAEPAVTEVRRFHAPEAVQAVAVDESHVYAIGNSIIAKYDKSTAKLESRWKANKNLPLRHLNGGFVKDGLLFCSNSNYPRYPETSSVEIFDTANLSHVRSHSLGIYEGSLTWIDWHDGAWWAVFAHYSKKVNEDPRAKPHHYTSLVKFDDKWRRLAGWVFPQEILDRFAPHSCSGGGWGPDNLLYCTGHDRGELYCLKLPQAGSELVAIRTIPINITGQGIAWDKSQHGILYGINRPNREVVAHRIPL